MNTCPFKHEVQKEPTSPRPSPPSDGGEGAGKLRAGLPPLTPRIAALPIDERGYPVPFFVEWIDGKPDFRVADSNKLVLCVKAQLCWTCGQPLGNFKAFPIGPMCAVNRTTAEPPSHRDCAEWSVKGCPFLSRPGMVRREDELTEANKANVPGEMITRNPGVTCIWVTKHFRLFPDGLGGVLFNVGQPDSVSWWREGRPATRAEVEESTESGLPFLVKMCDSAEAMKDLAQHVAVAKRLWPA